MILTIENLLNYFLSISSYSRNDLVSKIKKFYLSNTDISLEKNIYLRKYTGKNELNGILDYLPEEISIYDFEHFPSLDYPDLILGPLNIEEAGLYYSQLFKEQSSVYPIIHPLLASKFYRNEMFSPLVPENVYIPQNSYPLINKFEFTKYFKERNIEYVIIKDENGFHTGQMVPYIITPIDDISEELRKYKHSIESIDNFGGLIIEEFVGSTHSEIYKCHVYGEMIPGEVLKYNVYLKNLHGILKSYDPKVPDVLKKVDVFISSLPDEISLKLNPIVKEHLPYLFSSIDFVIDPKTDNIKIIDVNSIAGSLGEIQELTNSNSHNPFEFFVNKSNKFSKDEYKKEMRYMQTLDTKYAEKFGLEGI